MSHSSCEEPLVRPIAEDETVSRAVILAVEEATGRNATPTDDDQLGELDELYRAVDPDALDHLFRGGEFDGTLEFFWEGRRIRVDGGTHVVVSRMG